MHIHIHALIHYIRHARLFGSYLRFLGALLFMLLFSLLQLVSAKPTSVAVTAGEFSFDGSAANFRGNDDPAADPIFPDVMPTQVQANVFHRLQPGIVMIPRMNRTPKPKSVYRYFTRAPGLGRTREV